MSHTRFSSTAVEAAAADALEGRLTDPFAWLGPHQSGDGRVVNAFLPGAERVALVARGDRHALGEMQEVRPGFFSAPITNGADYLLRIEWPGGVHQETEDPYAFGAVLGDLDLHLFSEGAHWHLADRLGAQPTTVDGVEGVRFSVWAPNARRVSVVGDFNIWDGRRHPMRLRHDAGVWELFVPRIGAGERYKFEIVGADGGLLPLKADPLARRTEAPPATASVVAPEWRFRWTDRDWMEARAARQAVNAPVAIYEVHAGSWLRPGEQPGDMLDWDVLAEKLIPYVSDLGFTHIELLPVAEHPFGGSWGYQPLALFAPTARYGSPEGFARFVDACHRVGLGVIVDWVPAHFPTDPHGLMRFDGTALYEHADPREGYHQDWNTLIYNFGRREVQGFLIASALYWLETFHIDGLRVDAVASMLYRDYSRAHGEWVPNIHGGRENLEAIAFLKRLNAVVRERHPGAIMVAEESTAWPGVTAPIEDGGLGFHYKWNMGWMHDTLQYISRDPVHRSWHHNEFIFSLVYAFSEKFVLPISHDEVVHGKGSLLGRMPGDPWRRMANLRAYLAFMWTHPGKKLLFMGSELAQAREWSHDRELDWDLLQQPSHAGVQMLLRDLNRIYRDEPALHATDCHPEGFDWIVADDARNSVFVFERRMRGAAPLIVAINLTPQPQRGYQVGVSHPGRWREILNSDAEIYGGSGLGSGGLVVTRDRAMHGRPHSLELLLPPLGAIILRHED